MEQEQQNSNLVKDEEKSSTGLDLGMAGLLCYVLGFITGIAFLVLEKDSKFVKFHAYQSTFLWLAMFVFMMGAGMVPIFGWIFSLLMAPVAFIMWLACMFLAYQKKWFKFPVAGQFAEKQVNE